MPTHRSEKEQRLGSPLLSSWGQRPSTPDEPGWLARSSRYLDARRWLSALSNVVGAAFFVAGCVGFYWPGWYNASVTMFLGGSVLFLFGALGTALLEHGPST